VHPGLGGTPRPDGLNTIAGLARLGAALLDELWGASDRIVDPEYGLAYATAIPGAEFRMLPGTGTCRSSRPRLRSPPRSSASPQE
jgi:hypothetical protein